MVDANEVERVWGLLQGNRRSIQPTPLLHWFAVGEGNRAGDYASSPTELIQAARTCQAMGMNFYLQLNPSTNRLRMRARSEDVSHWMYLLMDVDLREPNGNPKSALMSYILAAEEFLGMDLNPHVIDSGRGYQAWFPFEPMLVANRIEGSIPPAHAWWIKQFNGESYGCVLDPAVADLPRVMRCPGTTNIKTGRMARIVKEGSPTPNLGVRVMGLAPMFVQPAPPPSLPGQRWGAYIPHLTALAARFLTQGAKRGDRHLAAVRTAKSLFERGCEEVEARRALQWGNGLSAERMDFDEIEQVLRSVYRRSVL